MEYDRPKLKIPLSKLDWSLIAVSIAAIVFTWAYAIIKYSSLPAIIAIHFNGNGQADNYGSKATLFILPVIITVVFTGMSFLNNYPHIFNYPNKITVENARQQYTLATRLIRIIQFVVAIFSLIFMLDMVQSAQSGYSKLKWYIIPLFIISMTLPIAISIYMFANKKKGN